MTKNIKYDIFMYIFENGGDFMLGKRIMYDIKNLPKKDLDKNIIDETNSDLTFFNIHEEETDNTIRMLKQNYVTNTYKDETILNLKMQLDKENPVACESVKMKSYKKYNEALDLLENNLITDAIDCIKEANELNPKDTDILNLKGLLSILSCNFKEALECFYTSMCYKNNKLPSEYVDILSSEEFNEFLKRYNHCIRFINEDLNQESIQILNNIIDENPEFIEPYEILTLIYRKIGNSKKENYYLEKLKKIDKSNKLLKTKENTVKEDIKVVRKGFDKKNIMVYSSIAILSGAMILYYFNNKSQIEKLNQEIKSQEERINETEKIVAKKEDELNQQIKEKDDKLKKQEEELKEKQEELRETKEELDKKEDELKQKGEITDENTEVDNFENAIKLKNVDNYKDSISYFKKVIENGKSKKYISESIYQVAYLSEKIGNLDDAKKYYKKYINTYTKEDTYYDESFYNLGLIYYDEGELKKAKDMFYGLRYEMPDSEYNNSKVKEILSK